MNLPKLFSRRAWHASLIALVTALLLENGQIASAASDDPIAAMVNGEPITRTELLLALEFLPAQFRNLPGDQLYPLIRQQLIDIKLLAAKGAEAGFAEDPRITTRRDFYTMRLIYDYFAATIVQDYMTEEFLHESYANFLENFSGSEELKISHILVMTEEEAEKVVEILADGMDFAEAARRHSVGPSAPQGGTLGFIRRAQVVPEFAKAAFALEDGEISSPVKTQFGWHIIQVSERRSQKPPSFTEMEQKLRVEITDRLVSSAAKEARETAHIELFELNEDFFDGTTVAP